MHHPPPVVRGGLVLIAAALCALVGWHVATTSPAESAVFPKCPSWWLCGLHCSGCGMTRAVHAGLNGDLAQMMAYNPFAPLAAVLFGAVFGQLAWQWVIVSAEPTTEPARWRRVGLLLLAGVVLAFGLVRNLPWHPFPVLAHPFDCVTFVHR